MNMHHRQSDEAGVPASAPIYQLVYCSRAAPGVDDAAVHAIIRSARRHNPGLGITGLLVFGGGIFFQWLEGPRDNIGALLQHLRADSRHTDLLTLDTSEEHRPRLFPDWSMELVSDQHIREVLLDALDSTQDTTSSATLRRLLQQLEAGGMHGLAAD